MTSGVKAIDDEVEKIEKRILMAGEVCKYCRFYGKEFYDKEIDKPGHCPMLQRIVERPEFTICSWFKYLDKEELIKIVVAEDTEKAKAKEIKSCHIAVEETKAAGDGESIDEPEINDTVDDKEDVQKFIKEVVNE